MSLPVQILWTPAGFDLPSLGARALVDVSDGDTPNIRMPIRMLSVDTPETTAKSTIGAARVDDKFEELVGWLKAGIAPVTKGWRDYILPRLEERKAGTLQFTQGTEAGDWYKTRKDLRLARPTGSKRNLFLRSADTPFDNYGRLLAYVAPSYSTKELKTLSRKQRATFNLDLVESGWGAPFIVFPSIPGELDLPLFLEAAIGAMDQKLGQYADALSLPGYEYRMCEKLWSITRKIAAGEDLSWPDRLKWRSRYCMDMRNRFLHGPEDYMAIPPPYRIWIWPADVQRAVSMLNLVPAPSFFGASGSVP